MSGQTGNWKLFITFEIQPLDFKRNDSPKRALLKGTLTVKITCRVVLLIHSWQGPGISWKSDVTIFVIADESGYTTHYSPRICQPFTVSLTLNYIDFSSLNDNFSGVYF